MSDRAPRRLRCPALLSALLLSGCQSLGTTEAPLQTLYRSSQCGPTPARELSARWLPDQASLDAAWQQLSRQQLSPPPAPQLQGDGAGALLIYQGVQPTGGYAIALAEPQLRIDGDQARIALQITRPAPDALTAAVITSPCLLLALPPLRVERVLITDAAGRALTSLPITPPAAARPSRY